MKTIGLLGGTSWVSTIEYYRTLNELVNQRLGGFHSASIQLRSINYHGIKSQYSQAEHTIAPYLKKEIAQIIDCPVDCVMVCNNSLHEFLDMDWFESTYPDKKLFHATRLTADYLLEKKHQRVLVLGTKTTMTGTYHKNYFAERGIAVEIPSEQHIDIVVQAQKQVANGGCNENNLDELKSNMYALLLQYKHIDAILMASTELPLIMPAMPNVDMVNPSQLQCEAAFAFAVEEISALSA